MAREKRELVTLRFTGARFEDNGLDLDVLPELIAYKRLLIETAKEVWRRRNPERQRLPRGFDTSITIKFFTLKPGSTEVPLVREVDVPVAPQLPLVDGMDEIDEAAALLGEAIDSADRGQAAPVGLPSSVVPFFSSFGETLRDGETIFVKPARRAMTARYDPQVRRRVLDWIEPIYEDRVDLIGEVRGTDLDGLNFSIRLADGRKVRGPFTEDQERTVLDAIGAHESRHLHVRGIGEFLQTDGSLKRLVSVESITLVDTNGHAADFEEPDSLLKMVADISAAVPDEAWKAVPTDLSRNLDRYLYGRKRDDE